MADLIAIKSGALGDRSTMPNLNKDELGFRTDEKALYIGTDNGNVRLCGAEDLVKLNNLSTTVGAISATVNGQSTTISTLNSKINEQSTTINGLNTLISSLQGQISAINAQIQNITARLDDLTSTE